jgi:translation initiation factor IF-2
LKCDSIGSVEAIKSALAQLPKNKILIKYLVEATGDITESDVSIAAASKGAIFAFNMTPSEAILSSAKNNGVEIRTSKIIYDIIEDVRYVMESKLPPIFDRKLIGKAAVNAIFEGGNAGKVAGCFIMSGYLHFGNFCIILRKNDIIHDAKLNSIRREKDQVKEVPMGKECGIDIDGFKEWEVGDLIECFETSVRRRTLEESN